MHNNSWIIYHCCSHLWLF